MTRTVLLRVALGASLVLLPGAALADGGARDPAAAEMLFRDAKALLQAGDFHHACPKLAESQRLDPGTGTQLLLAHCLEKDGAIASAWATYRTVIAEARAAGRDDRERLAREGAARLEPRLPLLRVTLSPGATSIVGLAIHRDGVLLGEPAWGTAMPVDPGEHRLVVTAPQRAPWTLVVTVREAGARVDVEVPELAPEPAAAPHLTGEVPPPLVQPGTPSVARTAASWTVLAAGGAALAVGGYFGISARSTWDDVRTKCPASTCTDRSAESSLSDARRAATLSTVLVASGLVLAGGGIVLLATRPRGPATAVGSPPAARVTATLRAHVAPGGGGLVAEGSF